GRVRARPPPRRPRRATARTRRSGGGPRRRSPRWARPPFGPSSRPALHVPDRFSEGPEEKEGGKVRKPAAEPGGAPPASRAAADPEEQDRGRGREENCPGDPAREGEHSGPVAAGLDGRAVTGAGAGDT